MRSFIMTMKFHYSKEVSRIVGTLLGCCILSIVIKSLVCEKILLTNHINQNQKNFAYFSDFFVSSFDIQKHNYGFCLLQIKYYCSFQIVIPNFFYTYLENFVYILWLYIWTILWIYCDLYSWKFFRWRSFLVPFLYLFDDLIMKKDKLVFIINSNLVWKLLMYYIFLHIHNQ